MIDHVCAHCGNPFSSGRSDSKFCSTVCYRLESRTRVTKSCEQCGKEFSTHLCYIKKGPVRFCSRDCYEAGRTDRRPVSDRFWEKVKKAGNEDCWIWQGAKDYGYGKIGISGKSVSAHRVSYEFAFGKIPNGLQINHKCDVRDCVNPNHLYAGTAKDNTADMSDRNRGSLFQPGELHHAAKITEEQAQEITKSTCKAKQIADKYGITEDHVTRLRRGDRWKIIFE